jgi:hypothetical protein
MTVDQTVHSAIHAAPRQLNQISIGTRAIIAAAAAIGVAAALGPAAFEVAGQIASAPVAAAAVANWAAPASAASTPKPAAIAVNYCAPPPSTNPYRPAGGRNAIRPAAFQTCIPSASSGSDTGQDGGGTDPGAATIGR